MGPHAGISVPFKCEACGRNFYPAEGGKCRQCGRLLCLDHFSPSASEPICVSCRPQSKVADISVAGAAKLFFVVFAILVFLRICFVYLNG